MKEDKSLLTLRHSAEHVLTQAMLKLFPGIKMAMGPATDDGFYFDFDSNANDGKQYSVSEQDFPRIEKEMLDIIKRDLPIVKKVLLPNEAKDLFKDNEYKQEWIEEIEKKREEITVYWTGDEFVDLCVGPHLTSTGKIVAFELLSIAGAYWRGSEKNKMLTRIYGTAFFTKKDLDGYLLQLDKAKKVDHRKLGVSLGLWTFSELVGPGLPLFTPKGALVRRLINEYVEDLQTKQGISQVWTPQIAKAQLFKISGHYDKYRENMFKVNSNYSQEEFYLKPMNCPQHIQIYASQKRSYRDLPIRYSDFAMLYRDEKPGELMGLIRLRSFSQDDCHIFCREDQIIEEMNKALDMTKQIMETYGFKFRYRLSLKDPKQPEKYIGDDKIWKKAEKLSEKVLKDKGVDYFKAVGEAAFYAPKLDLLARDSLCREHQLSTLQIDYFMPERFGLTYTDKDGSEKQPVILHRAISGSPERLMAILIEHSEGALPVWLSPSHVKILPITNKNISYAKLVTNAFIEAGIRAELDDRNETLQAKIRDSQMEKVPYMVIIGDKEQKSKKISVRFRTGKETKLLDLEKFIEKVKLIISQKLLTL